MGEQGIGWPAWALIAMLFVGCDRGATVETGQAGSQSAEAVSDDDAAGSEAPDVAVGAKGLLIGEYRLARDPVIDGDTIRVESEVLAARASRSRPTQGIVTFEHRGFNQRGELVCRAVRDALMHKQPA